MVTTPRLLDGNVALWTLLKVLLTGHGPVLLGIPCKDPPVRCGIREGEGINNGCEVVAGDGSIAERAREDGVETGDALVDLSLHAGVAGPVNAGGEGSPARKVDSCILAMLGVAARVCKLQTSTDVQAATPSMQSVR